MFKLERMMLWMYLACSTSGSVVIDSNKMLDTGMVDDTAITDDTGTVIDTAVTDTNDSNDTNNPDTSDSGDTDTNNPDTGTTDTGTTDTGTTDTGNNALPSDTNNPNIYPNYWYGTRTYTIGNCVETVEGIGQEVTTDYPQWLAQCDCDEIYYVQAQQVTVCGYALQDVYYYRGVKYDGQNVEIKYWPGNPAYPEPASTLGTGPYSWNDDGYYYGYSGQGYVVEAFVNFSE